MAGAGNLHPDSVKPFENQYKTRKDNPVGKGNDNRLCKRTGLGNERRGFGNKRKCISIVKKGGKKEGEFYVEKYRFIGFLPMAPSHTFLDKLIFWSRLITIVKNTSSVLVIGL
jgi:hypothetical protein